MSLFSNPAQIIEAAGVTPGQIIADFGAGSGAFALAAAKALASTGRVYAIDRALPALESIAAKAEDQHLDTIDVLPGDVEKPAGSNLADGCIDLVIISNILFQINNREAAVREAKRVLKPAGRTLVVDWTDSFGGIGPASRTVLDMPTAVQLFEKVGFAREREVPAGSHHYGVIFKKL